MKKSVKVSQKRRGRPATGRDPVSAVRLPEDLTASVDRWAEDHDANRSEAIRRLVEIGLTFGATKPKQAPAARAERASELASVTLDELGDRTAHPDERAQRHRRLTKGPEEFRDIRVDCGKAKGK